MLLCVRVREYHLEPCSLFDVLHIVLGPQPFGFVFGTTLEFGIDAYKFAGSEGKGGLGTESRVRLLAP